MADEKLVQIFKNLPAPIPPHVQLSLDRAAELDGPFEPRGSLNSWEETIRTEIADATAVATTASETVIVPNFTFPARYLMTTGRTLKATIRGRYGTTGTPTITVRQRIGGVTGVVVAASAAYTLPSTVTTVPFIIEYLTTVRTSGTTGTVFGQGSMTFSTAAPNTLAPQHIPASAPAASAAIDMTVAQDLAMSIQWGTSNAANTIQAHMYTLESLN